VRDVAKASQNIELSVLSAIAHGHGDVATAVAVALAAMGALSRLDEDRRALCHDLIEAALSQAARKAFEMLPQDYQFTGPTFLRAKLEGRLEGRLEGQTQGEADAVCTVLQARGLALSEAQRAQIMSCTELETVKHWVRRAVSVNSTDELFEP
jgi:isopropylmalate/homocitrate/citramalate synthase